MKTKESLKSQAHYKPTAPVSTGTLPKHGARPPKANFHGDIIDFDSNEAIPSAPPLELMDHVTGYESLSFDAVSIPPPDTSSESASGESDLREIQATCPQVSEHEARVALLAYVEKHCCYGQRVARDMAISKLKYFSAFHYELQTFTEKRETSWAVAPYNGGNLDGTENGPVPLPWDIDVYPAQVFQNEVKVMQVPHTASVKQCHHCKGAGSIVCGECRGKGWIRCLTCSGTDSADYKERCFYCRTSTHGRGRQDCSKCHAKGKVVCPPCDSSGLILCFIQLTITWKVNSSEHIVERASLPEDLIRVVSGQVAFEEEGHRISPINHFPDETINMASAQLVSNHTQIFQDQRILAQRQQVRVVPVTAVDYEWKRHMGKFYVYGYENKVYAPDYPQTCCCGCTIL